MIRPCARLVGLELNTIHIANDLVGHLLQHLGRQLEEFHLHSCNVFTKIMVGIVVKRLIPDKLRKLSLHLADPNQLKDVCSRLPLLDHLDIQDKLTCLHALMGLKNLRMFRCQGYEKLLDEFEVFI